MGAREDTLALNGLTVQAVGNFLGLRLPLKGMTRCPFIGHEDSNPSFEVRGRGNRWICYSCDRRGGAIDLVMEIRGLSFIEAKRWLVEKTGIGSDRRHSVRSVRRVATTLAPAPYHTANQAPEPPPDQELYATLLAGAPLVASGRDYLRGRSLNDEIISRFAIGQMPGEAVVGDLIRRYGFMRVEAAGLLTQRSTPERPWPIFPQGALLFPYIEGDAITYFQARIISGQEEGSRWRNLNSRKRRVYNADVMTQPDIRRVAICEGAIDVMSATQLGYDAIGLIGVSAKLSDTQIIALRGKQVDLLLDWDTAGEKRACTMLKELARFGIAATRKTRPSTRATDVNDYLREVSGPQ